MKNSTSQLFKSSCHNGVNDTRFSLLEKNLDLGNEASIQVLKQPDKALSVCSTLVNTMQFISTDNQKTRQLKSRHCSLLVMGP